MKKQHKHRKSENLLIETKENLNILSTKHSLGPSTLPRKLKSLNEQRRLLRTYQNPKSESTNKLAKVEHEWLSLKSKLELRPDLENFLKERNSTTERTHPDNSQHLIKLAESTKSLFDKHR